MQARPRRQCSGPNYRQLVGFSDKKGRNMSTGEKGIGNNSNPDPISGINYKTNNEPISQDVVSDSKIIENYRGHSGGKMHENGSSQTMNGGSKLPIEQTMVITNGNIQLGEAPLFLIYCRK